jgi:ribosomal protein S18 acetylase RimI-like enzyme
MELVRRWLTGWSRCRRLADPEEVPGGLRVTLGLPGRSVEVFALDDADPGALAEAARGGWLTVPTRRPDAVRRALERAGLEPAGEPEALMSTELRRHPVHRPPAPYALWDGPQRAEVVLPGGQPAAKGMLAVVGEDAVMHAVETEPEHRRRGLGSAVMAALARQGAEQGAETGLLVASPAGQRLYASLGWTHRATVLTAQVPD